MAEEKKQSLPEKLRQQQKDLESSCQRSVILYSESRDINQGEISELSQLIERGRVFLTTCKKKKISVETPEYEAFIRFWLKRQCIPGKNVPYVLEFLHGSPEQWDTFIASLQEYGKLYYSKYFRISQKGQVTETPVAKLQLFQTEITQLLASITRLPIPPSGVLQFLQFSNGWSHHGTTHKRLTAYRSQLESLITTYGEMAESASAATVAPGLSGRTSPRGSPGRIPTVPAADAKDADSYLSTSSFFFISEAEEEGGALSASPSYENEKDELNPAEPMPLEKKKK